MKKRSWLWKAHFLFYLVYLANILINFLDPDSFYYQYYHILMSFKPIYRVMYALVIAKIVFSIIILIPLFLYAFQIKTRIGHYLKIILGMKILLDFIGSQAEINFLKSVYFNSPHFLYSLVGLYIIIVFPTYLASYFYILENPSEAKKLTPQ